MGVQCPERIAEQAKKFAASSDLSVECREAEQQFILPVSLRGASWGEWVLWVWCYITLFMKGDLRTVLESKGQGGEHR